MRRGDQDTRISGDQGIGIFDRITEALFAVLALVTPLLWIEDLIDFAMAPKRALIETIAWALLTMLLLRWIRSGGGDVRRSFLAIPILILLVLGLCSFVGAINIAMGVDEYLRYLSLAALFFAALHHFNSIARMERFFACLVVSAAAVAVIGVCQYHEIAFTGITQTESPGSTFSHQNMAAEYLILILPFALYFGLRSRRTITVHLAMATAGLFVAFSFYVRARATWVAMVAAVIVSVLLILLRRKRVASVPEGRGMISHRVLASTNALLLVILLTWVVPAPESRGEIDLAERMGSIFQTEEGTTPFRKECWRSSWGMMTNHPVLGVGIGHWEIYFPRYLWIWDREKAEEMFGTRDTFMAAGGGAVSAHNDYLLILSEVGLGGALFFLLLIYGIFRIVVGICRSDADGDRFACAIALTGCAILFGVISVFSFPLELPASSAVLFIALGMLDGMRGRAPLRWKKGMTVALGVALILAICAPVYHFRLLKASHLMFKATKVATNEEKIDCYKESMAWHWYNYHVHYYCAMLRQQIGDLYLGDLERIRRNVGVTLEEIREVEAIVVREYEEAVKGYEECLRQHPYQFTAYSNEGLMYHNLGLYFKDTGMLKKAVDRYAKVMRYLIDHPPSLRQMATIAFQLQQYETTEKFVRHFLKCSNLSPKDREYGEKLLRETLERLDRDKMK